MDLEFDQMAVDTSLAQEYIKKNKAVSEWYEHYKNSTEDFRHFVLDGKLFTEESDGLDFSSAPNKLTRRILALVASLKQNAALIAQLEYYIRNIPTEDTHAQLNLIIQYLNSCLMANKSNWIVTDLTNSFYFSDEPLLKLQMFIKMILTDKRPVTLYINSGAIIIITHLFRTLFHEAGFHNINLKFMNADELEIIEKKYHELYNKEFKGLDSGTVAIVSEEADIDSAVDTFLSVSKQVPWRLRRILVQESVYQQFKDALSWKCNLKKQEKRPLLFNILCSDILNYNGKLFLIDPVDLPRDQNSSITVEAYRTRKEMISLLQTDKARYLSLWANDIAEINEVTHSTTTPIMWVNNIANFRGPPSVADAVFSFVFNLEMSFMNSDRIAKLIQSWQKIDYESRRDILCKVLDQYIESEPTKEDYIEIRRAIATCTRQCFVDVGKDYVCVGIREPVGILIDYIEQALSKEVLMSILNGNIFYVKGSCSTPENDKIIDLFEKAGVPFIKGLGLDIISALNIELCDYNDRVRVVWTNTGTIFAN